jgi:cytochrome c-type biogenesis protein CcmH
VPRLAAALALLFALAPVAAKEAAPAAEDPALEQRMMVLAEELRCLVCQNQTIAESNASLAQDLRQQVREQIAAGKSDDEIVNFMTTRYGDFVLYRPPLKGTTVLLWAGPALLLVAGFAMLVVVLRKRRAAAADVESLSDEDRERAKRLLEGDRPDDKP